MANPVVISDSLHVDGGKTSAEEARLSQAATWAASFRDVSARPGLVYSGNTSFVGPTATTSPSMNVYVQPLSFVAKKADLEGCYVGTSRAQVLVDIAAAPGSNSRIDVVYAMQQDAASNTAPDAVSQGVIGVVTGTAAVTPSKPAIPAGAVEIATVTVGAGAVKTNDSQVTITQTSRFTAPIGSPIPVRNQAERDELSQYDGLLVNRLDWNYIERSDGTTWVPQVDTFIVNAPAIAGATAPAGARRLRYGAGTFTYTTNNFGQFSVNFDRPYPNGLTAFVPTGGSSAGGVVSAICYSDNCTLSNGVGFAYDNTGSPIANKLIRLTYFSEGW